MAHEAVLADDVKTDVDDQDGELAATIAAIEEQKAVLMATLRQVEMRQARLSPWLTPWPWISLIGIAIIMLLIFV